MKKRINTSSAPLPIGPYTPGIIASGEFTYVSGQLPIDPVTGKISGDDITSQTDQSLKNVGEILKAGGYTWADVVKTNVYLSDLENFDQMNYVYEMFVKGTELPAYVCYQVAKLPMDALVEIEVIAVKD
jgi:2-iminobutanoate/2-iminopropanoate deaminase